MSTRFLAPLAACAFLFTGCDFIGEVQSGPTVAVTVSSVEISDLRQRPWDEDGSGPDLFVEIQDPGGNAYVRSAVTPDADLTQPLTFTFPAGFEVATETSNLFLTVFDDDGDRLSSELVGSSEAFTVSDFETAQTSLSLGDFDSTNGQFVATYTLFK